MAASPSASPAGKAAIEDMAKCGVSTSVLYKESIICAWAGVYEKPRFDFMKGQHQGEEFKRAYKKTQTIKH